MADLTNDKDVTEIQETAAQKPDDAVAEADSAQEESAEQEASAESEEAAETAETETEENAETDETDEAEEEDEPVEGEEALWYVVHTYSGYENKVKQTLEQVVQNRDLQDFIQEIEVPTEEVVEIKDGKKKVSQKKLFPGYVLIKMVLNDNIWYIVRNTRGVTGFVGPNSKPVPLRDEELAMMGVETDWVPDVDYEVGDSVKIINGPLESFVGSVEEINFEKKKVRLMVSMFGRETPVELDFTQVMHL